MTRRPSPSRHRFGSDRLAPGFTLVELMVVIVIIAVLVAISTTLSGRMTAKAEEAACTSNLRALHVAFAYHIEENGEWPQLPESTFNDSDQEKSWKFWITSLEPYGVAQKTWLCPTEWSGHIGAMDEEDYPEYWSSYIPTPFEAGSSAPFRWSNQPWVSERGDFHGNGVKLIMPNGHIRTSPFPQM